MKSFFKMFLASLLGGLTGIGCLIVILFVVISGAIASAIAFGGKGEPLPLKANTVLKIDVSSISEVVQDNPIAMFLPDDIGDKQIALSTAVSAIKKAKNNPNITALYLNVENIFAGMASIDALRRALEDFATSGKPIIAYADNYSQKAYYLCSVADKILLNPQGRVALSGLASRQMMFKGALDKLGVEMEVFRVGTFKSAVEPYTLTKLSEENRRQMQEYLDGLWSQIVDGIAVARDLEPDSLLAFVDRGGAMEPVESLVDLGLVDTIAYRTDVEKIISEALGKEDTKLYMIGLSDMDAQEEPLVLGEDKIKVIYAEGTIAEGAPRAMAQGESIIDYRLVDDLVKAAKADDVKAVVIRVSSPGGSAFLSEQIWKAVVDLRTKKPVVVSMGDVAASGGYYISAPASRIFAEASTLTGSIGIFAMLPNISKAFEHFGLKDDVVKTSRYADLEFGPQFRPLTPDQRQLIQMELNRGYEVFLSRVAEGRGMTRDQVDSVAQGRVWLGSHAIKLGLVDELGGLDAAVASAAKLANLSEYSVDYGATEESFADKLFNSVPKTDDFVARLRDMLMSDEERALMRLVKTTTQYSGMQARLPYEFEPY